MQLFCFCADEFEFEFRFAASVEPWRLEKTHAYLMTAGGLFGGSVVQWCSYWWCCGARLNCLVMRDLAIVISAEGDGDRGRARATFKCV